MTKKRSLIFLSLILGIGVVAFFLIKLASGYRLDLTTKSMKPTGLLVANSFPTQASIFINGKLNKNKTTASISLTPGEYEIEIKKDGLTSWYKKILIEKELVVKTDAYLFSTYPDLKALTSTGASKPVMSPDGKKVVFAVDNQEDSKNGLWVLDLTERPLGLEREPKQIVQSAPKGRNFAQGNYEWSPDSKQVLVTLPKTKTTEENFLLDISVLNDDTKLIDMTEQKEILQKRWLDEQEIVQKDKMTSLPEELSLILEDSAKDFAFSPDESRLMYTATAAASIPKELIPPLPGASSQKEARDIEKGKIYVYDFKEDRNFYLMDEQDKKVSWFPTSRHIFLVQNDKISIIEYDGTNQVDLYSGPFENSFAFPFSSGNKILVLTSLSKETPPNLYSISLR
ncbi:PEGA domain-containing protein [Candidatus Shapirobacteria bacterium]|nr:PEGA domain-containing protein [Candidatus Shapirobacteria bacterium]